MHGSCSRKSSIWKSRYHRPFACFIGPARKQRVLAVGPAFWEALRSRQVTNDSRIVFHRNICWLWHYIFVTGDEKSWKEKVCRSFCPRTQRVHVLCTTVGLACSHQRDDKSTLIALATTRRTSNRGVSFSLSLSLCRLRPWETFSRGSSREKRVSLEAKRFCGDRWCAGPSSWTLFSALTSSYVECK